MAAVKLKQLAAICLLLASVAAAQAAPIKSRVTNGTRLFLDSEVRSVSSRRFRDLLVGIISDLGGQDAISTGQMQLARRCALISVQCEVMEQAAVAGQPFDVNIYGELTDRLGRALQRLGLKRRPRDVTPTSQDYLAAMRPPQPDNPDASH
jgi:hypothetical protein